MNDYRGFYRGRRVAITGGLGFIGSNLARELVTLGARVLLVDSLFPEYGGNTFNIDGIEDATIDASGYAIDFPDNDATHTEIQGDKSGQDEVGQTITGTGDNDALMGKGGNDVLNGLGGNDILDGGAGADVIVAGAGNDLIIGGTGNDSLDAGAGDDVIAYTFGDGIDSLDGGAGFDTLNITGTAANNVLNVIFDGTSITAVEGGPVAGVDLCGLRACVRLYRA